MLWSAQWSRPLSPQRRQLAASESLMSHLRAWQSWWSLWWAADCRSSQCGSCCVLRRRMKRFQLFQERCCLKRKLRLKLSHSLRARHRLCHNHERGSRGVGRSGFLGNSLRVSSERRERLSEPSGAGSEIGTHECSLMVKNDTHCREWERMDVALGDYAVAGLVEVCNLCATSVIKPYITEDIINLPLIRWTNSMRDVGLVGMCTNYILQL